MSADDTIQNDIAYLRGLAESGRRGPILGGSILFASGLIYSAAAVVSWAIHSDRLDIAASIPGAEWWIAGVFQIAVIIFLSLQQRGRTEAKSPNNRLFGAVWSGLGGTIGSVFGALAIANERFGQEIVFMAMPAVVFGAYGAGWAVCAAVLKRPWMHGVAGISYGAAIATPYLISGSVGLLVYAAIIFATIGVPGLMLMREAAAGERSA